jgi:alkylhydroperoxidase family enzyme
MAARVPYLNREDLPEADRVIFDNLAAERGGTVGNIFKALAHTPNLLRRFCQIGSELRNKTALDPKLRELAICTVGCLTDAQYEFVHHWNIARRVGVSREQLKAFLDTRRLMELVQNVAFYNMVVRVLVPVGVELEPGTVKN